MAATTAKALFQLQRPVDDHAVRVRATGYGFQNDQIPFCHRQRVRRITTGVFDVACVPY